MTATVSEKIETTRRRFHEERARIESEVAETTTEFVRANRSYQAALDADEETSEFYNECMRLLGRTDALKRQLSRMDEAELERRLENSRRLAERFA